MAVMKNEKHLSRFENRYLSFLQDYRTCILRRASYQAGVA